MYGIASVVFIIVASLIYYQASTYNEQPFEINEIQLERLMTVQNFVVFGTCIDKVIVSKNPLQQLKLKSHQQNTFAIFLDHNPWLKCQQLPSAFDLTKTQSKKIQFHLEDIPEIRAIIGEFQVKLLQKDHFLNVKNHQLFVLVLQVIQINQLNTKDSQNSRTIMLAIENQNYSEPILQPLLLLGIFNLIGVSLIAYYKKNVFNTRVKLLSTVSLLVYLMWIGFDAPTPLQETQQKIKLAMTCFLLIICIKNHLNTCQTSIIILFSVLNQFLVSYFDNKYGQDFSLLIWLVYFLNFINASFITQGQNVEVVYFSIFGFVMQYGLVNQAVDIMHPLVMSLILVTLLFGPIIFQLLLLKDNFDAQVKKTIQRLHSYEVSQNDTLFQN